MCAFFSLLQMFGGSRRFVGGEQVLENRPIGVDALAQEVSGLVLLEHGYLLLESVWCVPRTRDARASAHSFNLLQVGSLK